ncbi:MAG: hypothetical protein ACRC28_18595 [Clostridium sp.]|uniref:hypothetical protein n=1 Tax=Clostridium sp. TaxID=1506 RepID=UPI003F32AAFC
MQSKIFKGKIDGDTLLGLVKQLDYNITDLNGRMEFIRKLLNGTNFFDVYFAEYYKSELNMSDALSENNNICKGLESLATYILNSEEVKLEKKNKETQYVFYRTPAYFNSELKRELSINQYENLGNGVGNEIGLDVIHFLRNGEEKNVKYHKKDDIYSKDLVGDSEMSKVLREYQVLLDVINHKLINREFTGERFKLTTAKSLIKKDMLDTKRIYKGTINMKLDGFKESTDYNLLEKIDLGNELHVLHCLKYASESMEDDKDFTIIMYDLQQYINRCKLSEIELEILELWKLGHSKTKIGEMLDRSNSKEEDEKKRIERNKVYVIRTLKSISKRVASLVTALGGY